MAIPAGGKVRRPSNFEPAPPPPPDTPLPPHPNVAVWDEPSVWVFMENGGDGSAIAFDVNGEIIETLDWYSDGTPDWTDGGICDHRGGGGEEGYRLLHDALTDLERNYLLCGGTVKRLALVKT